MSKTEKTNVWTSIVGFFNKIVDFLYRPKKSLTRSNEILGGVCGGLAKYWGIDPVIIRLLWACAIVMYGSGALLYIICWIIIPEE